MNGPDEGIEMKEWKRVFQLFKSNPCWTHFLNRSSSRNLHLMRVQVNLTHFDAIKRMGFSDYSLHVGPTLDSGGDHRHVCFVHVLVKLLHTNRVGS